MREGSEASGAIGQNNALDRGNPRIKGIAERRTNDGSPRNKKISRGINARIIKIKIIEGVS